MLDTKIEDAASGLIPYYSNLLRKVSLSNKDNALTIMAYINVMRTEANLSDHYRMDLIRLLPTFSNYFQNKLSFKQRQVTRDNLLAFLDSFRKPESVDPKKVENILSFFMQASTCMHIYLKKRYS
jgi:hypothetical protein